MVITLDLNDGLAAAQLLALQRRAYQQEAELIGYPQLPPLLESLPQLIDCGETILAWREQGELLAALGYQPQTQQICRLVVHPSAQRQGLATRLLQALINQTPGRCLSVSTAMRNLPALALYARLGFIQTQTWQTADGLHLAALQRTP